MKLLFLTRSLSGGGAEKVTTTLANYCSRMGNDTHLLTYAMHSSDYEVDSSVVLHDHSHIPEMHRPFALRKLFSNEKPDAIISLGSKYHYIALSGLFNTGKVILSERNDPEHFYSSLLHRSFVAWCYKKAAGVVFQTDCARSFFNTVKTSKVIPNPVADPEYRWSEETHEKMIVNYCRLEPQKNLPLLIDAFTDFYRDYPAYRLMIYGDGSLRESLEQQIIERGLEDCAVIKPFCSDVHEKVSRAEIFVSSSDYEGMSNSLLEAVLIGIPVVSTDCGGGSAREVLKDFPSPCLVKINSREQLACSLKELASNQSLRTEISEMESHVALRYSPEIVTTDWISFIEYCVGLEEA